MLYDPLPTDINQRAQFFQELEGRYAAFAYRAEELVEAANSAASREHQNRVDNAGVLGQGVRKPPRLEYLEASYLLQAPAETNGKASTEAQRTAWVTKHMQDSAEYKAFLEESSDALQTLNAAIEETQEAQNELRLVYACMSHLDAWIAFFGAPRPIPPAPRAPVAEEWPNRHAAYNPHTPETLETPKRGGGPRLAEPLQRKIEEEAAAKTPSDDLPF